MAPYAAPKEAARLEWHYALPPGSFVGAKTNSALDAPALPGRFPVVVFYHGSCAARTDTTALNEHLASLGFVVVALGSTHEADLVQFPDGRTVPTADPRFCVAANAPDTPENSAILHRLQRVRVADVRFVLEDPRVLAGVNLDGLVVGPVRHAGLSKPLLDGPSGAYPEVEFRVSLPPWSSSTAGG